MLYATPILFQGRPTDSQINGLNDLQKEVKVMETKLQDLLDKNLSKLNKVIEKQGKQPLTVPSREEWEASESN